MTALAGAPHPRYRLRVTEDGLVIGPSGKVLKPWPDRDGYLRLAIYLGSYKYKYEGVHVLVCETFYGPRPEGKEAAHSNGNRQDNHASNLSWKTTAENCADRVAHGTDAAGERNGRAKITEDVVRAIRRARAQRPPATQRALAVVYGISVSAVKHIDGGRTWGHIS